MPRSAQDFIRALKAPADPPHPGGPSKLAVARDAWDDPAFYVPNKDEAVAEWLLGRLLKDRATAFDAEHWILLRDVLASPRNAASRPLKTWLLPLLHRTPLAPIVVSVYGHLAQNTCDADIAVVLPFSECVSILWPFATVKYNTETLLECFSAVLRFFGTRQKTEPDAKEDRWFRFLRLSQQIVASYRVSVANSSNKKKVFSGFVQNQMADWFQCISPQSEASPYHKLYSDVYEAGLETLFNADALRQTQDREDALYPRIFSQLLDDHPAELCQTLPRLFQAFVHATRKHRASIFGQSSHQAPGSSAEQARLAALRFFAMCDSVLSGTDLTEPILRARVDLLELVDAEGLYGVNNEPAEDILRRSGDDAISMLAAKQEDLRSYYALSILSKITRIDYDLLSQHVPSVLPHLFTVSPSIQPAFEYLDLILDYHSKTRTLDVLVDALLQACRAEPWLANGSDKRTAYRSAASSTVFQQRYLGNLSRLINSFLTPGQVLISAESITRQLRETLQGCNGGASLGDDGEKRPRKRRKSEKGEAIGDPVQAEAEVVAFALQSRIAATVLSALPTRFLEDDVRATVQSTVQEFYSSLRPVIKDTLKQSRGEDGRWDQHLLVSSALRLKYVLRTSSALHLSTDGDKKLSSKLLSSTKSATLLPELWVEVLRMLLADVDFGYCAADSVYDALLDFVGASQEPSESTWTGGVHNMDSHAETGIALIHVLLERWLPQFDTHASGEQLQRLVKFITSPHLQKTLVQSDEPIDGLSVSVILQRTLHNAELWELPRLRDSLLEQIDAQTKALSGIDVTKALASLKRSKGKPQHNHVSPLVAATYGLLLYIPMEYLSRPIRTDLMRRAVAADVALAGTGMDLKALETSLLLREYLRRAYVHAGQVEPTIAGPYLLFLLRHTPKLETCSAAFVQTTLELIEMHLLSSFKAAAKGDFSTLTEVINHLSEATYDTIDALRAHCLILLIDLVVPEHKASAIDRTILEQLITLQRQYLAMLETRVAALSFASESNEASQSEVLALRLWDRLLVFQTWLELDAGQVPRLGGLLVSKLLSPNIQGGTRSNAYVATLSIVQQECRMGLSGEARQQLEMVIGSYLAFCAVCEPKERQDMDELVGKFSKRLSLGHFADLLNLVLNGLSEPGLGQRELTDLVTVAASLLQNAPEGSSKVTQAHFTSCLHLFAARPQFPQEAGLQEKSLRFVASQLNNRPAAVRQQDLSSIWSILGTSLGGGASHDVSTRKEIFHEIISILSALIRLRRDLVTSTLPHLGHVLRRLLQSLRHIRPNLGAKQTKMVADTLPRWICTSSPLSTDEAKAVARLLTTMTTKTLVRGQPPGDPEKAESLSRPFSKHAAYVLVAYAEAMNDPLCVLPQDTRRELEPGLFALCDMMGEYNRDAMMVASLDAPGKVVMKSIWREYEKQKYVGKG